MAIEESAARLDAIMLTRGAAARAAENALVERGLGMSEAAVCERWLAELGKNSAIEPCGWYAPPPHGMSVLVGDPPDFRRTTFASLREVSHWPRSEALVDEESLLFLYCSPVHRSSGMIGDFQMSLYGGSSSAVRRHIAATLDVTVKTVEYAAVGMEFAELYDYADRQMRCQSVRNDTNSTTDVSGQQNIGHTVPWFESGAPTDLLQALAERDHGKIAAGLSPARTFITGRQRARIGRDSSFTVEPQVTSESGILATFHFIVTFCRGDKVVLAGFSNLFATFGMTEFLEAESMDAVRAYDSRVLRYS
ncbi:hypothetical protein [Rugosimonospora africana]|uniref:M24 family metallopeptidase n=1 Tax=Rugosimonospora africana TaxID=556532 RepID=A0A8J3R2Q0_9ACTN|nr:hypothetical protein [Rugosimonospora africana]GIH20699.1 hypothetical protein Raf01_88710 [Rugosimonospora africana]